MDQAGKGEKSMKKTISEQIKTIKRSLSVWRKAYDSKEGKIIFIRRTRSRYYVISDVWEIRGTEEYLYSVPGTIPLYVTILE